MKSKDVSTLVGLTVIAWHLVSLAKDADRWLANLNRWRAQPSLDNLARLLLAEGILIRDLGWLI